MKKNVKQKINKWIIESWENKWYEGFDHWHIDDFDNSIKDKSIKWFDKGIETLQEAHNILREYHIPLNVAVSFPLNDSVTLINNPCFKTVQEFTQNFSKHSSPALHLFDKKEQRWKRIASSSPVKNIICFLPDNIDGFYYQCFDSNDNVYLRSIWLVLKDK
jgi:hypothetical protein